MAEERTASICVRREAPVCVNLCLLVFKADENNVLVGRRNPDLTRVRTVGTRPLRSPRLDARRME